MSNTTNHNSDAVAVFMSAEETRTNADDTPAGTAVPIHHLYVHIPFCARICPYCAFYKDLLDRSRTSRFCEATLRDLDQQRASFTLSPETIYFEIGRASCRERV